MSTAAKVSSTTAASLSFTKLSINYSLPLTLSISSNRTDFSSLVTAKISASSVLSDSSGIRSNVSTGVSSGAWNGTFADVLACNAASLNWISTATYLTLTTETLTLPPGTVWAGPPNATVYTTLCDGTPRAHGEGVWTAAGPTLTYTDSWTVTATSTTGTDMPTCTINPSQCAQLWSYDSYSWSSAYSAYTSSSSAGLDVAFPNRTTPACPQSFSPTFTTACVASNMRDSVGRMNPCYFQGGPIQLAYWPVSVAGDLCGNRSTIHQNISRPMTASIFGTTVASPGVLVSISTFWAEDLCGNKVGTPISNYILPQQTRQISTQCMSYHAAFGAGTQVNFADFNQPVPATAYNCQPQCAAGGPKVNYCSTFFDNFNPYIAIPTDLMTLQPEWARCTYVLDTNFLSDPPIALTQAATVDAPDVTASTTPTSVAALPASLPATVAVSTSLAVQAAMTTRAAIASQTAGSSTRGWLIDPVESVGLPGNGNIDDLPATTTVKNSDTTATIAGSAFDSQGGIANAILSAIGALVEPLSTGTTVNSQPVLVNPSNTAAVVIGGTTISAGQTMVIGGETVAVGSNAVVIGTTTLPLARPDSAASSGAIITLGSSTAFTIQPTNGVVAINGQILTAGQTTTIAGQVVSAGTTAVIVGSSTIPITIPPTAYSTAQGAIIPLGSTGLTMVQNGDTLSVNGQSLTRGQTAVVSGQTISYAPSAVIVGGSTVVFSTTLIAPSQTSAVITIQPSNLTVAANDRGVITVNGITLSPGQTTVIAGKTIADASTAVIVDGNTVPISQLPKSNRPQSSTASSTTRSLPTTQMPYAGSADRLTEMPTRQSLAALAAFLLYCSFGRW